MLLTKNLRRFACEINNASGVVKSSYTTPEEIAGVIKKPVGYLTKKGAFDRHAPQEAEFDGLTADDLAEMFGDLAGEIR